MDENWIPLVILLGGVMLVPTILQLIASERQGDKLEAAIQEVHVSLNSRLTELLETTAKSSRMEGAEQERREERQRVAVTDAERVRSP